MQDNITHLLDSSSHDLSLTLRYEPGQSLDRSVDPLMMSTLPRPACDQLLLQMSDALAYLHSRSIVHDDVKPENIVWSSEDRRAVLIDFGAAFFLTAVGPQARSVPSGTPPYVPPEFLQRRKGEQGDVWALGVVMLFALGCVALPDGGWLLPSVFEEGEDRREMKCWLEGIERLRRAVAEKDPLVGRMLEPDPDARIGSRELRDRVALVSATSSPR